MIDGVMNLSHWNICWKSNMVASAAPASAAALNFPNKINLLSFSSAFGQGGFVATIPLKQVAKFKHRSALPRQVE